MPDPRIGDLIQLPAGARWAYAQYTNEHAEPPSHGSLLRVLVGLFDEQQTVETVQSLDLAFNAFVPLKAAIAAAGWSVIGNADVRDAWRRMPTFRTKEYVGGMPHGWKLWSGDRLRMSDLPPEELRQLTPLSTLSPTALSNRIASGWRPDTVPL